MALNLTTLMTRIGHQLYAINDITNPYRGTTLPNRANLIQTDYASSDEALVSGLYPALSNAQNAESGWLSYLSSLANATLIQMAVEAGALPDRSLNTAMNYVVSQMTAQSQTVKASVVGSSVTPGGANVGNATVLISTKLANGKVAENTFFETVTATCINDALSGSATAGQETMRYQGQIAVANPLSWLWPAGSGCNAASNAISALANQQGSGNWLNNGSMESFVTNTPVGWHYGTGVAGTDFLKSVAVFYDGLASLQWVGGSGTNLNVYQQLGVDTTVSPTITTQLGINFALKVDVVPAAGVLTVELVDGSSTIINDGQGTANSFTVNLHSMTTAWTLFQGVFRLPAILPSQVRLRFILSTAMSTGTNLFLDHIAMGPGTSIYRQGPMVWTFSNSTNLVLSDNFGLAFTNTPGLIQQGFNQLFGMMALGYLLPSSASPTLADGTYIV